MKDQIKELVCNLENMCIMFYQEKETEGCKTLNHLLPDLTEIITADLNTERQVQLLSSLQLALQALEAEEWIMLADVFQYEICDKLKEC